MIRRISFVGTKSKKPRMWYIYACWQESNKIWGKSSPKLFIKRKIGELQCIPVIDQAYWLINFCRSFLYFFWSFHHISAPYKATDGTAATCILRSYLGQSLQVLFDFLIWASIAFVFFILSLISKAKFRWLSSYTSNYWVASILKRKIFLSILSLASNNFVSFC